MFTRKSKLALVAASIACLGVPASAHATNGYFAHGYGTKAKALGGATAALPQDSLVVATNPAGLAFVGDRYDLGWEFFAPRRGYSITGSSAFNGAQGSENDFFIVPHGGISVALPWDATFGMAAYGNGGMNTEYSNAVFGGVFGGSAPTGVDLLQGFVPLTYSQKVTKTSSLGVSVIYVYQMFKAEGLQPFDLFASERPGYTTNNGYDHSTGVGYKIGGQMDLFGGFTLAAAYQPKIDMTEFTRYSGLFAGWGDFDIPSNYVVGAAWKITPGFTAVFDYQRINYTDVPAVSNSSHILTTSPGLGDPNGPGFGWDDINVYKLGLQYAAGDWTWRAGWNHGENPVYQEPGTKGEIMFNILAPGIIEDHLTLGFSVKINPTTELSVSYMHGFKNSVSGANPDGSGGTPSFGGGTSEVQMSQNSFELSLGGSF